PVARDADDLREPLAVVPDPLAQRVFARPEAAGERLVHDDDGQRARTVLRRGRAPAYERDPHRLEVAHADDVEVELHVLAGPRLVALHGDEAALPVEPERDVVRERD